MRRYQHAARIMLMDSRLRPSRALANADFVRLAFDRSQVRVQGQATLGDALRSHHGQGVKRVLFLHKMQTSTIVRIQNAAYSEYLYARNKRISTGRERGGEERLWELVNIAGTN